MQLQGKVYKSGKFWLAECPALDAMTQGKSKRDAINMLKDWIQSAAGRPQLAIDIAEGQAGRISIETKELAPILALMLQRAREESGLSVRQVAAKLGLKSHTAYAQYERGKSEPSLSQLEKFLAVISPTRKLRLRIE